jgi:peptidyl-prolyl cis-trans isomerase A (cyclophilin A)
MKHICFLALISVTAFSAHAAETSTQPVRKPIKLEQLAAGKEKKTETQTKKENKMDTAILKTTLGTIKLKLFKDRSPKTVENFVGLATGSKEWTDPKTGEKMKGKSLYAGTIFHRVIPNFMIQGGDPLGRGIGGPGYKFADETDRAKDKFDKPGILAMANAGPNTNGSQFFITVVPTPHLNGNHTIFGEVTEGMDVVLKIAEAPRDAMDKPKTDIKIESITIE